MSTSWLVIVIFKSSFSASIRVCKLGVFISTIFPSFNNGVGSEDPSTVPDIVVIWEFSTKLN